MTPMPSPPSPTRTPRGSGRTIARIAGIDIIVDASWFFSVAIFTWLTRVEIVPGVAPGAAVSVQWVLAFLFTLPLYACIILHELAHSLVARAYGLPVHRITLFMLGGVSQIEREAPTPAAEYHVALAGPLTSLTLAGLLGFVARVLNPSIADLLGPWGFVAYINLALAIFNLIPAFPMDGGRILRSILWAAGRSRARATRWAVRVGASIAVLFIVGGAGMFAVANLRDGSRHDGLWTALVGVFLYNAAHAAGRYEGGEHPNEPPVM